MTTFKWKKKNNTFSYIPLTLELMWEYFLKISKKITILTPNLSQTLIELKEPTANISPDGLHETEVMTWSLNPLE